MLDCDVLMEQFAHFDQIPYTSSVDQEATRVELSIWFNDHVARKPKNRDTKMFHGLSDFCYDERVKGEQAETRR